VARRPFLAKNKEICPGPLPADGLEPHGMDLVVERTPPGCSSS
jgi:hypothetical protein